MRWPGPGCSREGEARPEGFRVSARAADGGLGQGFTSRVAARCTRQVRYVGYACILFPSSNHSILISARLEKTIASEIVTNELSVENSVSKNLNDIIERHLSTIHKQKRTVSKCHQEYEATRQKYDVSCSNQQRQHQQLMTE